MPFATLEEPMCPNCKSHATSHICWSYLSSLDLFRSFIWALHPQLSCLAGLQLRPHHLHGRGGLCGERKRELEQGLRGNECLWAWALLQSGERVFHPKAGPAPCPTLPGLTSAYTFMAIGKPMKFGWPQNQELQVIMVSDLAFKSRCLGTVLVLKHALKQFPNEWENGKHWFSCNKHDSPT